MHKVNSSVIKYIEQMDAEATRIALTTIAYIGDCDAIKNFKISTEYAKEHLEGLFQEDDGVQYEASGTIESYKNIIKLMMSNFSERKYEDAIKIGETLFYKETAQAGIETSESREEGNASETFFTLIKKHPLRTAIISIAVIVVLIKILK